VTDRASDGRPYEAPSLLRLGGHAQAAAACTGGSGDLDYCNIGLLAFGECSAVGTSAVWPCTSGDANQGGDCRPGSHVTI
jgi:hypothetical protein